MKISDYLFKIRHDLNDLEKDWFENDEILISYFNDGLCEVFNLDISNFTKPYIVKLKAGDYQEIDGCCKFIRADAITNSAGAWLADMKMSKAESEIDWTEPCCSPINKENTARRYYFNDGDKHGFSVRPPIPNGIDVYARLFMSCKPALMDFDVDTVIDYPCEVFNPAYEWALYRAFSVAKDSANMIAKADRHYKAFYDLMKIRQVSDKATK